MSRDNVFSMLLQNALSRAYPSGLPSNQVIQQISSADDNVNMADSVNAYAVDVGYPYGYGEAINNWSSGTLTNVDTSSRPGSVVLASGKTTGSVQLALNEGIGTDWVIRLTSFQPPNTSIGLTATIGNGLPQAFSPSSPAQCAYVAGMFDWSSATFLGKVGTNGWNTPSGWTDTNAVWVGPTASAATSALVGQWLLKKQVYCPVDDYYTFFFAADDYATVYVDGSLVGINDDDKIGTTLFAYSGYLNTTTSGMQLSAGLHTITVEVQNGGLSANPTGFLFSMQGTKGNIIENGSTGENWLTTGFINQVWSLSSGLPSLTDTYYVISSPSSENVTVTLTLNGISSVTPQLNQLWWYAVAPWRWDASGEYDQTTNTTMPVVVTSSGGI